MTVKEQILLGMLTAYAFVGLPCVGVAHVWYPEKELLWWAPLLMSLPPIAIWSSPVMGDVWDWADTATAAVYTLSAHYFLVVSGATVYVFIIGQHVPVKNVAVLAIGLGCFTLAYAVQHLFVNR